MLHFWHFWPKVPCHIWLPTAPSVILLRASFSPDLFQLWFSIRLPSLNAVAKKLTQQKLLKVAIGQQFDLFSMVGRMPFVTPTAPPIISIWPLFSPELFKMLFTMRLPRFDAVAIQLTQHQVLKVAIGPLLTYRMKISKSNGWNIMKKSKFWKMIRDPWNV